MTTILIVVWTVAAQFPPANFTFESAYMCQQALAVLLRSDAKEWVESAECRSKEQASGR